MIQSKNAPTRDHKRISVIQKLRWLTAGCLIAVGSSGLAQDRIADEKYFLSRENPIVTADQKYLVELGLRALKSPEVVRAKESARNRWTTLVASLDPSPEAMQRFDQFLDEYVFHYTLKGINSDPHHPRIVRYDMLPHQMFGVPVPGSRQGGGDSPDNIYSLMPLEHGPRYELKVSRLEPAPADVTYSLMGNLTPTMTLGSLEGRDIVVDKDGKFTITIDPEPANGRPNHIQSQPDTRYLFVRESLGDWKERPARMRINRLDPPSRPPLSEAQMFARAARYVLDDIPAMYWWLAVMNNRPVNEMSAPFNTGAEGGLVSQQITLGKLNLGPDDVAIVTLQNGDAGFRNFVLHDYWFNALEYVRHQSSLNQAQSLSEPDGTTTYAISARDPGVHNWLDTQGVRELLVVHRWQALPRAENAPKLTVQTKVCRFQELDTCLPEGLKRVTSAERKAQLQQRQAEYARRMAE